MKYIIALILATAAIAAQAKDVAGKEQYYCYAFFDTVQDLMSRRGKPGDANYYHYAKNYIRSNYIMDLGTLVDFKMDYRMGDLNKDATRCNKLVK